MSVLPSPDEHADLVEFDRLYWLLRGARATLADTPADTLSHARAKAEVALHLKQLLSLFDGGRR